MVVVAGKRIADGGGIAAAGTGTAHKIVAAAAHHIVGGAIPLLRPFPVVACHVVYVVGFRILVGSRVVAARIRREGVVGVVAPRRAVDRHFFIGLAAGVYKPLQRGVSVGAPGEESLYGGIVAV